MQALSNQAHAMMLIQRARERGMSHHAVRLISLCGTTQTDLDEASAVDWRRAREILERLFN